jgi:peptidoglycan hydrolase-like protein with peptidoglycan-binding domain
MAFKQIRNFYPAEMGSRQGWCEQNVREGFRITKGTYPSAKADMEAQKRAGTFHAGNPPANIAVPVFCDTASKFEHVVASDHGRVYSDKKFIPNGLKAFKVIGWGELCDGVRVVEPTVDPSTGFLPARGYWRKGDTDPRIGQMSAWMRSTFPAYTPASALGQYFGPNLEKSVREFQRRTNLLADGCVGPKTYAKMQAYGFKG